MALFRSGVPPYLLTVLHVLKHVDTVVDDGVEHLLVVLHTLADVREVGEDAGQKGLVVLGEAPVLTLSPLHLLVDVDSDT